MQSVATTWGGCGDILWGGGKGGGERGGGVFKRIERKALVKQPLLYLKSFVWGIFIQCNPNRFSIHLQELKFKPTFSQQI